MAAAVYLATLSFLLGCLTVNSTQACGGNFTSLNGIIQSPNYPGNYGNQENCVYFITAQDNHRITLTFTNFDLEFHSNCTFDYVEVRDGDNDTSPLLGRYCGDNLPNRMRTFGHQMWIKFVSDGSVTGIGFRATYTAACGGNFTSLSGIIQSPNYPGNYGNKENCVYLITVPDNHRITLTFTSFDIEFHSDCNFDYLEVRDGDNDTSPLLGRYCGQTLPNDTSSFGPQMWIKFVSDSSVIGSGFRATYTAAAVLQDAFLLISSTTSGSSLGDIFYMEPETSTNYTIPMSNQLYNPIAVDYDPVNKTIYWTEVGVLNRVRASSLNGSGVRTLKDAGEGSILDGLAVDVKSRLIFYTDAGKDEIVMMTMSTLAHRTVISSSQDRPRAIVLNTADGVMFWTDWGTPAKIERASYDGTNRQTLITYTFGYINALALDVRNNRLYWADAFTDKVEVVDMEGKGRRVLFNTSVSFNGHFFGLALNQDVLYITNWGKNGSSTKNSSLLSMHLTSGEIRQIGSVNGKRLNDIHAYSEVSFDTSPNGCGNNNGGCSVFCIPLPGNSSKCMCPDGQTLTSDQKTCVNACGRNFTSLSGIIQSPNYPGNYSNEENCVYLIVVPDSHRITLTFTNFDIEFHSDCNFDYVEVRDGDNDTSPLLGRYCGQTLPNDTSSFGPQMWIKFVSDGSVIGSGFRATYTTACGRNFTSLSGIIQSPNYPGNYSNEENCVYLITVPDNHRITLTFTNFDIEFHSNCNFDYVEVRDGDNDTSPLLGRYCGQTLPNHTSSFGPQMWIKFVSDGSVIGSGFRATYTTACGRNFTSLSGIIQSPNYPGNYSNEENCVYLITVPDNHRITLTFTNFDIEFHSNCNFDYVEVRDGDNDTSPLLGRYCGQTLPNHTSSFGPQMWIKFVSDGSVIGSGFRATYTTACGRNFTSLSGIIQSPNYPGNYSNEENCVYLITVPDNHRITLTFTNFDIEFHSNCNFDYVEVRDGDNDTSPLLGRYCGQTLPNHTSSFGPQMWIKFVSDGSVIGSGFRATYTTACGRNFTSLSGIIQSPNYPGNYSNEENCVYLITVPDNHRITLTFTNFDIEFHSNCNFDYVEVRDGDNDTSPLLGRYCGQTLPNHTSSFGPQMWIKFVSDGSVIGSGFRATYTTACGRNFTSLSGIIQSPNYPGNYSNEENCVYLITVPDNHRITLTFTNFDIEFHSNCNFDYVEVRDGDNDTSPLLGRYCGQTLPNHTSSFGPQMWIKFVSDGSVIGSGFRATYTTACGRNFTSLSGIIQSPNYPGNYSNEENCVYLITVPDNHRITLTFTNFDIEFHSNCNFDYVEVRDGDNDTSPLLGRYCGQTLPNHTSSFGPRMWIKFVSDGSIIGSGFRATYTAAACGGNFTSLSGIIQSPKYPGNYSNQENCVYLITAPDNHRITLTFTSFDIEFHSDCNFDYVEVRDGDSDKSPRIGRYCGQTLPNRIRTFGHQMWIKFVSNGSVTGSGFRANYTTAVLQDALLLISSTTSGSPFGDIFCMDPETITNYAIPMSSNLYNPIAVDYDPVNKTIYWTEVGNLNSRVRASSLSGSGVRTLKDAGEGSVLDGLAVDAKSRLIFYTDAGKDEIVMMTMNTLAHKTVINSSQNRPRAIVLNTADGVMFWTDWGKPAKIERASYDGTNRQILITDDIGLINALALDVSNNRLYWADAFTDKVEVVDMEGKGRKALFGTQVSFNGHFFGLALYHDVLYATNWGKNGSSTRNSSLLSMHLTSGEIRLTGSVTGKRLNDIHAYSEVTFDTSPNGCGNNNGGCSVFCIPMPSNSSRCTCPDGQTLTSDQKTCVDVNE